MSGRLSFRAIEAFVAVIEAGSIAAGAKRLGASASSVSQQLSNLEAALGAALLDRGARPLALTPAGYMFQRRALAILDEAAQARSELMALGIVAPPRLRIAMIDDLDATLTPDLVAELAGRHSDCSFTAYSGQSHDHIAALQAREVEIAVAADPEDPVDEMERHPLLREPYVLVTAKGLVDADGDVVSQLLAAPMARYVRRALIGRQIERHLRRLRLSPPHRFEFDSTHSVFATVRDARGWALTTPLSWLHARRFQSDVDVMPLPFAGMSRMISLYARKDVLGQLPARMAALCRRRVAEHCIGAALEAMPWLAGSMTILGEERTPAQPAPTDPTR
jgi:DNA-binding transcriptional LysR family regulator